MNQRAPHRAQMIGDLYHAQVPSGAVYVGRLAPGLPGSPYANRHRPGSCRSCGHLHDRVGGVIAYVRDLAARPDLVAAGHEPEAAARQSVAVGAAGQFPLVLADLAPEARP